MKNTQIPAFPLCVCSSCKKRTASRASQSSELQKKDYKLWIGSSDLRMMHCAQMGTILPSLVRV